MAAYGGLSLEGRSPISEHIHARENLLHRLQRGFEGNPSPLHYCAYEMTKRTIDAPLMFHSIDRFRLEDSVRHASGVRGQAASLKGF